MLILRDLIKNVKKIHMFYMKEHNKLIKIKIMNQKRKVYIKNLFKIKILAKDFYNFASEQESMQKYFQNLVINLRSQCQLMGLQEVYIME